jgi:hypothetical protein
MQGMAVMLVEKSAFEVSTAADNPDNPTPSSAPPFGGVAVAVGEVFGDVVEAADEEGKIRGRIMLKATAKSGVGIEVSTMALRHWKTRTLKSPQTRLLKGFTW